MRVKILKKWGCGLVGGYKIEDSVIHLNNDYRKEQTECACEASKFMRIDKNPYQQFLFISIFIAILTTVCAHETWSQANPKKTYRTGSYCLSAGINSFSNIKSPSGFNHDYSNSKIGFIFGVDFTYRYSKRSALTLGMHAFDVAYNAKYSWTTQQPNDPALPLATDIQVYYKDASLAYDYNVFSKDKFAVYGTTGFVYSFLRDTKGSTTYGDNSVRNFASLNSHLSSIQLGIGFQYNIDKYYGIRIESNYRQFLKGFDSIMDQYPRAINVTIGLVCHFDWECFLKKSAWRPLPICD